MISCSQEMPSDAEEVLDDSVHREKSLRLSRGLEPSHLSLPLPRRLVGDFRPIVFVLLGVSLLIGPVCQSQPQLDSTLREYVDYYHACRTHLSLEKDAPSSRPVEPPVLGKVKAIRKVGGLHHHYTRLAA